MKGVFSGGKNHKPPCESKQPILAKRNGNRGEQQAWTKNRASSATTDFTLTHMPKKKQKPVRPAQSGYCCSRTSCRTPAASGGTCSETTVPPTRLPLSGAHPPATRHHPRHCPVTANTSHGGAVDVASQSRGVQGGVGGQIPIFVSRGVSHIKVERERERERALHLQSARTQIEYARASLNLFVCPSRPSAELA